MARDCQLQPYKAVGMNPTASSWLTSRELHFAFPHSHKANQACDVLFFLFVCTAFKGRNTKEQGKMCEMELFIPWKLISIREMPSNMVGDRSEVTALDSQAATSRRRAEFQHLAPYNVQTLTDIWTVPSERNL